MLGRKREAVSLNLDDVVQDITDSLRSGLSKTPLPNGDDSNGDQKAVDEHGTLDQVVQEIGRRARSRLAINAQPNGGDAEERPTVFNEQDYLLMNPDVADAVKAGAFASGYDHWTQHGRQEGRVTRKDLAACIRAVRSSIESVEREDLRARQLPASPPTLRGRIGRRAIRLISRLIAWYTAQVQGTQAALLEGLRAQADLAERLAGAMLPDAKERLQGIEGSLSSFREHHNAEMDAVHARQRQVDDILLEQRNAVQAIENAVRGSQSEGQLKDLRNGIDALRSAVESQAGDLGNLQAQLAVLKEEILDSKVAARAPHEQVSREVASIQTELMRVRAMVRRIDELWVEFSAESQKQRAGLQNLKSELARIEVHLTDSGRTQLELEATIRRRQDEQGAAEAEIHEQLAAQIAAVSESVVQAQRRSDERLASEELARQQVGKQAALRQAVIEQTIATERDIAAQNLQRLQHSLETEAHSHEELSKQIYNGMERLETMVSSELAMARKNLTSLAMRFDMEANNRKEWVTSLQAAVDEAERKSYETAKVSQRLRECLDAEVKAREVVEFRLGVEVNRLDHALMNERQEAVDRDQGLSGRVDAEIQAREQLTGNVAGLIRSNPPHDDKLDPVYVAFADTFRGPRDIIKERQRVYIPYLQDAGISGAGMPVLDIGCGRGELLELLRDSGLHGRGIDQNASMVSLCQQLGLNVEKADALEHLQGLSGNALGAIAASHVVEHIPFPAVIALLDEALRTLRPGGILILETPNPENLQVGAHTFYTDPTHRNPLPPPMLKFFVEARGFIDVETLPLHPYPDDYAVTGNRSELVHRFNAFFYGPQDYAVIGRKAAPRS